ncbi:MAG: SlyX family protein [Planctomycetaceae bacterium]|nr:SlyX family protein [Planctomycetaceae bacterium]
MTLALTLSLLLTNRKDLCHEFVPPTYPRDEIKQPGGYSKVVVRNCLCRLVAKMPESPAQPDRVVELETLVMHLQQDLATLNGVVIDQQKQLDSLTKRITKIDVRVARLGDDDESRDPLDERPPHY